MLIFDAIKITIEKTLLTVFNILVFRNILSGVKYAGIQGFWAFVATMFLSAKVRKMATNFFNSTRAKLMPDVQAKVIASYPKDQVYVLDVASMDELAEKDERAFEDFSSNQDKCLFNHIFSFLSESALLSLATIISIEHLHSNREYSLVYSTVYCLSIIVFVLFGNSLSLAQLIKEANEREAKEAKNTRALVLVHKNESTKELRTISIWSVGKNADTNQTIITLKHLAPVFKPFVVDIMGHIIEYRLSRNREDSDDVLTVGAGDQHLAKKLEKLKAKTDFIISEHYFGGLGDANKLKPSGYTQGEKWITYTFLPLIDTSDITYRYTGLPANKTATTVANPNPATQTATAQPTSSTSAESRKTR